MTRTHSSLAFSPPPSSPRAWVAVVSRAHVQRGVAEGFTQACHGRRAPLARMSKGDWLVYYSPTLELGEPRRLRAFTGLGRVCGEETYTFDMGNGFVPSRRDMEYLLIERDVPVAELAPTLSFIRDNPRWGMLARRGHFEIPLTDLQRIARALLGHELPLQRFK